MPLQGERECESEGTGQKHCMRRSLQMKWNPIGKKVRVKITDDKEALKKEQTRRPHCWSTAEPREEILAQDKLHLEKEESTEKNRDQKWPDRISAQTVGKWRWGCHRQENARAPFI